MDETLIPRYVAALLGILCLILGAMLTWAVLYFYSQSQIREALREARHWKREAVELAETLDRKGAQLVAALARVRTLEGQQSGHTAVRSDVRGRGADHRDHARPERVYRPTLISSHAHLLEGER